jgi:competence protein ComFC
MRCLWCHQTFFEKASWQYVFGMSTPSLVCEMCNSKFEEITGEICEKCGRPLMNLDPQFREGGECTDCVRWEKQGGALTYNRSIYLYNDFLQEVIAKWKYRGDAELVKVFSEQLLKLAKQIHPDIVVPIPLSTERLYERSFNQAKLIAECLPYPIVEALQKPVENRKQSKKSRVERLGQADHFQVIRCELAGKSILLVDDIYTTGATLYSAAALLKQNGAKKVTSITIARG